MNKLNVLITGIGGPIAQGIMMGLSDLDYVTIVGADRRPLTSGHHFCDETYQIPRYTQLDEYKEAILNIVEQEEIDAVFPSLPQEIAIYDEFRSEIPAKVALPESDHFEILENKVAVYKYLEAHHLGEYVPEYYSFTQNNALRQVMKEKFQDETYTVVKPAETYGAIGSFILTDRDHYLKAVSQNKKKYVNIEDYYDIESFEGQERFVMPFLNSTEYSVDLYLHEGDVVVAVPRERTGVSSGIVLEGKVVYEEELLAAATEIAQILITDGFINLQFFETKGGFKLTDINPRFAGSQILSFGADVNFPEIFLNYAVLGEEMKIEPKWDTRMFRYRVPVFYQDAPTSHEEKNTFSVK